MKPERDSDVLLATTRARAKMHEYRVAEEDFNRIPRSPSQLFSLTIGMLGDVAGSIVAGQATSERLSETRHHLLFCARFFDSYFESRLDVQRDPYMLLLASATYYLAQFPGSADVVASRLATPCPTLEARGLEELLSWVLKAHFRGDPTLPIDTYDGASQVATLISQFFAFGTGSEELLSAVRSLRHMVYGGGTARELLLADLIGAVVETRRHNSTWSTLPRYSDIAEQVWAPILQRDSFIRELWPAQQLLGTSGLYRGTSAVVQMPTSAGKTRALDLIIRGSFYSARTSLAIVIAPFRALCEEIRQSLTRAFANETVSVDELSDVQQADFDIQTFLSRRQVLVMTPEKCLYLMRHSPEIANGLGLLIYDEGHQFDSGRRGVTYELLLTALKGSVPESTQTVLISAVLTNAQAIADWLLGAGSSVVSGANLLPTTRALAFVSWRDTLGRLEFTEPSNPDLGEFFVPRIIEQQTLRNRGRERTERLFPERDSPAIGLYLALKVAGSGGVAVFAGTKLTAGAIARKAVDVYDRGFGIPSPASHSDPDELRRLALQNEANLGDGATSTKAARLGIFSHHGNTPHGIRLAVEHAMKEGLVRMVVCTSTLAQGVNLPIRYLIVTGAQQGQDRIKTRDFHNLLGRAGRAGMYTEGTVIFSDPQIFDRRAVRNESWRWQLTKALLDPSKSEECKSSLLSVLDSVTSVDKNVAVVLTIPALIAAHAGGSDGWRKLAQRVFRRFAERNFTEEDLVRQFETKSDLLSAIESFLLAHWDENSADNQMSVEALTASTLAFHLANAEQRVRLVELFEGLAENISSSVPEIPMRRIFSRSLFGLADSVAIREWVGENADTLTSRTETRELLRDIWPLFRTYVRNNLFLRCDPPAPLLSVAEKWTRGLPFSILLEDLTDAECRFGNRKPTVENAVEICENAFGFDGMLIVGAVAEMLAVVRPAETNSGELLRELQKEIKYGLSSGGAITLYELGFADRVIAQELANSLGVQTIRRRAVERLAARENAARVVLAKYPKYFTGVLDNILT